MKKTLGLLLLIGVGAAHSALAQQAPAKAKASRAAMTPQDQERYMTALSDARRRLFADAMSGLTAAQLEAFWGVYADFEKEKNQLAAARVEAVRKFAESFGAGLTDADIKEAVQAMGTIQKSLIDLRLKYFDVLSSRIDTKTAGHFALTDDFVATSIRLEWLNNIPFPGDKRE